MSTSPTFSLAAYFRNRLEHAGSSHGVHAPSGHFRLMIPPGVDCHPDLHKLAAEYNRAVHDAARSHDEIRTAFLARLRPILADFAARAGAIETARPNET